MAGRIWGGSREATNNSVPLVTKGPVLVARGDTPIPPGVQPWSAPSRFFLLSPLTFYRVASGTMWGVFLKLEEPRECSSAYAVVRGLYHMSCRRGQGLTLAKDPHRPRGVSCFLDGCTQLRGRAPSRQQGWDPTWAIWP